MSKTEHSPEKNKIPVAAIGTQALTIGGEVGCLTVFIVLVAVFGGLWLDNVLGTKPLLTLLFVLGSAPVALVLTFWLAKRAVKSINPSDAAGDKPNSSEGDKTGD